MAKIYSENSPKQAKKQHPSKETILFLLNYSKALKVSKNKNLEYETFLN